MNDRFKFRAYDETYKRFLYRTLIDSKEASLNWEQCTGLKDKNGKLIYEGDILKDMYGVVKIVYWDEQYSSLRVKYQDNTHCGMIWQDYVDAYEMEVIGNVHENTELLKESK